MKTRKKLIEVALPLEAINAASAREKSIRHGHPSTLHLWWARRPLATARAVIFAQMVDDPSAVPELFPTEKAQQKERERLFRIIEDLVKWENTTNEGVLQRARDEIWQSWRRACADNADHPRAKELFDRHKLPAFHDPFAGGGSLPLEAQRLGLEAYASDLNPVAVLINKAMIEIPPKFAGRPPVNPESRADRTLIAKEWRGAAGLAEDVRYYGRWMRDEAERRIGHLYPQVDITVEMASERPDLKHLVGEKLTVIAWLWARTVKSPNPAFADVEVPLASTFMLSTKPGKEAYVQPIIEGGAYRFAVKVGRPPDPESAGRGTSAGKRAAFRCLMSDVPIPYDYIRAEGKGGRMGARLMAVVAEGTRERIYLSPDAASEALALAARPTWRPDCVMPKKHRNFQAPVYGMENLGDIFTSRQLVALATFSDLVGEVRDVVRNDTFAHLDQQAADVAPPLDASLYVDAISILLALAVDKAADYWTSISFWHNGAAHQKIVNTFARQAIPMCWDYAEGNPFSSSSGHFYRFISLIAEALDCSASAYVPGLAMQQDAAEGDLAADKLVSTDPPYYDNICYADLSDFFYVWLRRSLRAVVPGMLQTMETPKVTELVASANRHGSQEKAEEFFLGGMTRVMHNLVAQSHPGFPLTIYYSYKQNEIGRSDGQTSTGWETFLGAIVDAGLAITATWPMRTEYTGNLKGDIGALASSIVLACHSHSSERGTATRREFIAALRDELPGALSDLQRGNVAPVDMAQASIGPGMAIYTRYSQVLEASGARLGVGEALRLINQTLDEVQTRQEGDFDSDSRWALAWFEECGFAEGDYGRAETLSKAKVTSVEGLRQAGIVKAGHSKVQLLRPAELPADWDPQTDKRLTDWEIVHHLIRVLGSGGEAAAAELVRKVGSRAETARELCYRLYTICERKKRSADALSYNALVQSWPEIMRLARDGARPEVEQGGLFE